MQRLIKITSLVSVSLLLFLVSCEEDNETTPKENDTVTIDMTNNEFDPAEKTIEVGTTVKWVNQDDYIHNVTSDDDIFVSGDIEADETYSYTFENTGTFPYVCTIHDGMDGTIIVE